VSCVADGLRGNYITNYTLTQLEDGELYAIPDTYDVEFETQGMKVNFRNLFNGNKLMGETPVYRMGDTCS
jgi:hypothetical protein